MRTRLTLLAWTAACTPHADLPPESAPPTAPPTAPPPLPEPTPASPPEPEPPAPPTNTTLALTGDTPATFGVAIVAAAAPDALPLFDEREFACDLAGARSCAAHGHAELALGDHRLVALRFETRWEHDGMYGSHESIALVVPGPAPQIVHTVHQWDMSVFDCGSELAMRRWAVINTADGPLLCIESVSERGIGLFDVMDLDEAKKPWLPLTRQRERQAFRWDDAGRQLRAVPTAASACPRRGYRLFVPIPDPDLMQVRSRVQGDARTVPCPRVLFGGCMVPECEGKSRPRD